MEQAGGAVFMVLVIVFVVWFYGPWQSLCVDWGRERMFEARNAIFDMAADGRLSFGSPEYREIRRKIESSIAFAHRISWPSLVLLYLGVRRFEIKKPRSIVDLLAAIPDDGVRREVQQHTDAVTWTIVRMIVFRSTIFLAIYMMTWVLWKCGAPVYWWCEGRAQELAEAIQDHAPAVDDGAAVLRRRYHLSV